jgi:hypothetical protein
MAAWPEMKALRRLVFQLGLVIAQRFSLSVSRLNPPALTAGPFAARTAIAVRPESRVLMEHVNHALIPRRFAQEPAVRLEPNVLTELVNLQFAQ